MTIELSGRKVFLASPGDLVAARSRTRDTIRSFNESTGIHDRGVVFLAKGWEDVSGGIGRPQDLINEVLDSCDFAVVMLGSKWGSDPVDAEGRFTSGTEEEFFRILDAIGSEDRYMRNLLLAFKSPSIEEMAAPSSDLLKIQGLRAQIERDKPLLFETFDSPEALDRAVLKALQKWSQPLEARIPRRIVFEMDSITITPPLADAARMVTAGLFAQAELALAPAARRGDLGSTVELARLFRRSGRFSQAKELGAQVLSLPAVIYANDDVSIEQKATLLSSMGVASRKLGDSISSIQLFEESVRTLRAAGLDRPSTAAYAYDNIGHARSALGDLEGALSSFTQARELREATDDSFEMAQSHVNVARARSAMRQPDLALIEYEAALACIAADGSPAADRLRGNAHAGRARALLSSGSPHAAAEAASRSLSFNAEIRNAEGVSIARGLLARSLLAQDDIAGAEREAQILLTNGGLPASDSAAATGHQILADTFARSGDYIRANDHVLAAESHAARTGDGRLVSAVALTAVTIRGMNPMVD